MIEKINFLQRQKPFLNLPRRRVSDFTDYLIKTKFYRGQTVYKEFEPANFMYFIYKGEFELSRQIERTDARIPKGYEESGTGRSSKA